MSSSGTQDRRQPTLKKFEPSLKPIVEESDTSAALTPPQGSDLATSSHTLSLSSDGNLSTDSLPEPVLRKKEVTSNRSRNGGNEANHKVEQSSESVKKEHLEKSVSKEHAHVKTRNDGNVHSQENLIRTINPTPPDNIEMKTEGASGETSMTLPPKGKSHQGPTLPADLIDEALEKTDAMESRDVISDGDWQKISVTTSVMGVDDKEVTTALGIRRLYRDNNGRLAIKHQNGQRWPLNIDKNGQLWIENPIGKIGSGQAATFAKEAVKFTLDGKPLGARCVNEKWAFYRLPTILENQSDTDSGYSEPANFKDVTEQDQSVSGDADWEPPEYDFDKDEAGNYQSQPDYRDGGRAINRDGSVAEHSVSCNGDSGALYFRKDENGNVTEQCIQIGRERYPLTVNDEKRAYIERNGKVEWLMCGEPYGRRATYADDKQLYIQRNSGKVNVNHSLNAFSLGDGVECIVKGVEKGAMTIKFKYQGHLYELLTGSKGEPARECLRIRIPDQERKKSVNRFITPEDCPWVTSGKEPVVLDKKNGVGFTLEPTREGFLKKVLVTEL